MECVDSTSRVVIGFALVAIAAGGTASAQPRSEPPGEPAAAEPAAAEPAAAEPAPYLFDIDAILDDVAATIPTLETVARGTLRRGRRAISIGPTIGVYGAAQPSPGEVDVAITAGLGLELFKIPVLPSRDNLRELIKERARAKLEQVIVAELQGKHVHPLELQRLAAQIYAEAIKEVLGVEDVRPRTVERPRLSLAVEGSYAIAAAAPAARLRAGLGIWKLTVGLTAAAAFTDPSVSVFAGAEVVVHALTSSGPRASVVDVFVRGEAELRHRDVANTDTVLLGARYLLDLL